jgi:hypothetical protein
MGLIELQQIRANRDKPKEKKVYRIPPKSAKRIAQEKAQKEVASPNTLNEWFDVVAKRHLVNGYAVCQECGGLIPEDYMRHATAHLLAKKLFKSIATNDLNYLVLCAGNGCHDKTHRLDKFVQMKVWPVAAKRITELIPLLPYDEMKYISKQLYDALENT